MIDEKALNKMTKQELIGRVARQSQILESEQSNNRELRSTLQESNRELLTAKANLKSTERTLERTSQHNTDLQNMANRQGAMLRREQDINRYLSQLVSLAVNPDCTPICMNTSSESEIGDWNNGEKLPGISL